MIIDVRIVVGLVSFVLHVAIPDRVDRR